LKTGMEAVWGGEVGDPWPHRPDPTAVEIDGHRALQEGDGDDETAVPIDGLDEAFSAQERAFRDADAVTGLQEGPRLDLEAGPDDALESIDLALGDRLGAMGIADDLKDARGDEDGEAGVGIEAAEDVVGEEREVDIAEAPGVAVAAAVEGEEIRVTLVVESGGDGLLMVRLDVERESRVRGRMDHE